MVFQSGQQNSTKKLLKRQIDDRHALTRDLVQEAQPQDNIELFAELKRTEDKLAAIEDDEKINRRIPMDYSLYIIKKKIIIKNIYLPYLIKIDLHFEPFSNFNVAKPMHHM